MDCSQLVGRLREICEHRSGLPREVEDAYIALWEGKPPAKPSTECVYRGEATGDFVTCGTCSKTVRLKLFGCQLHGLCTIGASSSRNCLTCESRLSPEAAIGDN